MSEDIKAWSARVKKTATGMGREKEDHEWFFRDPGRPMFADNTLFMSPADGIIMYQTKVADMKKPVLEVKGKMFTLPELMDDTEFDKPSLVIGIFMTEFCVHVNRMPTAGVLRYELHDTLGTTNLPMLQTQKGLLRGIIPDTAVDYIMQNERMVNRVYNSFLDYSYYMVQIADDDVDVIMPFSTVQNRVYGQCQRFSLVRWGSQVDLVLPLTDKFKMNLRQKELVHVEAGTDPLIELTYETRKI
jgi:phosphatidylserine decarboxylase